MFCFTRSLIFLFVAIAIASAPGAVDAQEKKKAKKAGFNVEAFLKRLDVNQNGKVEPGEIKDDRTRGFLKNAGVDTSKPINIKKFSKKIKKKRDLRDNPGSGQQTLGFSVGDDERDEESGDSPGFAVSDEERDPIAKTGTRHFSEGAKQTLEWVLRNYDKNKDGKIDKNEIREARWNDPPVSESDTNKDGSLSRMELLVRYQKREDKKSKSKNKGREDRKSRWGDRERNSGKRSESKSKSKSKSANRTGNRDIRKGYEDYVGNLFKSYDKNKDGSLDEEEIDGMRRKPDKKADANGDKKITKEELINSYLEKAGQGSSKSGSSRDKKSRSSNSSSSYNSSNGKGRPQLTSKDVNKNGKIEMAEFAKVWTIAKFEEFRKIDKNDDRVITKAEWDSK